MLLKNANFLHLSVYSMSCNKDIFILFFSLAAETPNGSRAERLKILLRSVSSVGVADPHHFAGFVIFSTDPDLNLAHFPHPSPLPLHSIFQPSSLNSSLLFHPSSLSPPPISLSPNPTSIIPLHTDNYYLCLLVNYIIP